MSLLKIFFKPKYVCAICGKTERSTENMIAISSSGSISVYYSNIWRFHESCIKDVICKPLKYGDREKGIAVRYIEIEEWKKEVREEMDRKIKAYQKEICS